MSGFLFGVSLLLFLISGCVCIETVTKEGSFYTASCFKPEVQTILRIIPKWTTTSDSTLNCAVFCNQDQYCTYAVFNAPTKTCELMHGLTNTFKSNTGIYFTNGQDESVNSSFIPNCQVLSKVLPDLWSKIELTQLSTLQNIDKFSTVKAAQLTTNVYRVKQVSQTTVNVLGGVRIATSGKALSLPYNSGDSAVFTNHVRQLVVIGTTVSPEVVNLNIHRVDDNDMIPRVIPDVNFHLKMKNLKLDSDVLLVDTLQQAMASLLTGHRPIGPHPTRAHVLLSQGEIHQEVIETIQDEISSDLPQAPFYFTSIKEYVSASESKRFILKHQIMGDAKLPWVEQSMPSLFPWVMDSSWATVEGNDNDVEEKVRKALLHGKPARIIINGEICTDIIAAMVTPSSIMVAMAAYIHPFEGKESKISGSQEMRFPLFKTSGKQLVECVSDSVKGGGELKFQVYENQVKDIQWIVSTKRWIKIFEVTQKKSVTFGTYELLKDAVVSGKNIRVCVEEPGAVFYCLNSPLVAAKRLMKGVVFESYPFIKPVNIFDTYNCPYQRVLWMTSTALMERTRFSPGSGSNAGIRIEFERISWFAEEN